MKKLSVEEKAERYDEAIERAKAMIKVAANQDEAIGFANTIFPELKEESEDEKTERILYSISTKISFHLRDIFTEEEFQCFDTWSNVWLEKQAEQKPIIDGILTATNYDKMFQNCKVHKFNVGDWIVQENIGVYKVIEVCESWYEVIDIEDNHYSIGFDKEYMCHLWSINDAKDGDVLVADSSPFIYNGSKNEVTVGAYCGFNVEHKFSFAHNYVINQNITPATKEQRDILFKAMTDAGYTFDFEKKELKIIDWSKHIKYEPNAPSIIKDSDWSEEDENFFNDTIAFLTDTKNALDHADWIKSLKQRIEGQSIKQEEKDLLLQDLKWCDMETNECHCYNCELFDNKNNVCKCIDLCKRPKNTYKGFYVKIYVK